MKKKRFTFGTVIGIDNHRGDLQFTIKLTDYLEKKGVDPCMMEFATLPAPATLL